MMSHELSFIQILIYPGETINQYQDGKGQKNHCAQAYHITKSCQDYNCVSVWP